jgi:hypothetical protein
MGLSRNEKGSFLLEQGTIRSLKLNFATCSVPIFPSRYYALPSALRQMKKADSFKQLQIISLFCGTYTNTQRGLLEQRA